MIMHTFMRCFLGIACLGLVACQSPLKQVNPLSMTEAPVGLAVSQINVVLEDEEGVDESASWVNLSMTKQVEQWLQSRYRALGGDEQGAVAIRRVALKSVPIATTGGLFSNEAKEQYEAVLEVRFEIRDETGFAQKFASAKVRRSAPVSGSVSLSDRQAIVQQLINETITQADRELLASLKSFLPLLLMESDVILPQS